MRITNSIMANNMLANVSKSMNTLDNYYTQMSSGKKIQVPSDDPLIASRALRYRTTLSDTTQYSENVEQANSWLEITSSALGNMTSILTRMRELCTEGASDTYTQTDREKILAEYTSLTEQLENEMNTTYMGRYVFSGYKTNTPPISENDDGTNVLNPLIYGADGSSDLTDGQDINIEVSTGIYLNVNSFATDIYDIDTYTTIHSFDERYQQMLNGEEVNQTILRNDFDEMQDKLDSIMNIISKEETNVGVKSARMELTSTRLDENYANYSSLCANNEDVDYAEASMNYMTANSVYTAALKVGMNITQLTLADYL
jgi:flagellar hook-associated protein 3 FlgL